MENPIIQMELKIVRHKTFKRIFINFLVICLIVNITSFILFKARINVFPFIWVALGVRNVLLYALVGVALIFAFYIISNKQKLRRLQTFDEKIRHFEKYYTRRLWWHVISCLTSAIFLQLTWHIIFFYFSLFDLLSLLSAYPSREILKKELDEEDLIFN